MLLIGRHNHKFFIVLGLNKKSKAGIFLTMLFYEKITVLPSKNDLHMERWPGYFLEIVACLSYLPLSLSHQATSPMTQHIWRSVKQPPSPGKGWTSTTLWELQLAKGCPKIPTEHCSSISNYCYESWTARYHWKSSLFSIGKRPCLPKPSLNESSPSVHAKTEVKFCLSLAGNSFPLVRAQLPLGDREQKAKLFAIMYLKCVNKITLQWVHIPLDLAFRQQSSKYVPWQECLLRQ